MLASHPYFFANLPLLAAVCLFLILGRRGQLARLALYSGLACLPCSLVALVHGNYWRPARLGGGPIGVEDLIFTFTSSAAVWLCAASRRRRVAGGLADAWLRRCARAAKTSRDESRDGSLRGCATTECGI